MASLDVQLRPFRRDDLWLLERQAVDPEAAGLFNWSGYRDVAAARRQFEQNGLIGPDDGQLVVVVDGDVAGKVAWGRNTYGTAQWWCWTIGIALLPEFRGRGGGTAAQGLLVGYLFDTTTAQRIEALTDVDNEPEQRALTAVGFSREGVVRSAQFRSGRWCDLHLYGILRHEFRPLAPG
jgi:RimJ/RimL family protein N-acetyltransferase